MDKVVLPHDGARSVLRYYSGCEGRPEVHRRVVSVRMARCKEYDAEARFVGYRIKVADGRATLTAPPWGAIAFYTGAKL